LLLTSAWGCDWPILHGAAYLRRCSRTYNPGRRRALQISREVQLVAQRAPALDRLRLDAVLVPDFVCDDKQVIGVVFLNQGQTSNRRISKSRITAFDDEIPPKRAECNAEDRKDGAAATGRPRAVVKIGRLIWRSLRRVAVCAPDNDSSEPQFFAQAR